MHLDCQFKGISTKLPGQGQQIRDVTFAAFDNLILFCIREEVDFLLVAGDVYNQEDRSLRAQLKFRDGLKRLQKHSIATLIVHGNHDPLNSRSSALEMPDRVHVFAGDHPQRVLVQGDGPPLAEVTGISHSGSRETRNLAKLFDTEPRDLFQIGLLHCNLKGEIGHDPYAPCELQDLLSSPFDYWALGHVHEKKVVCADPYVVYPGNIQGLHVREGGERGCYLARVSGRQEISLEFVPLDCIRWLTLDIDIQDCMSLDQLEQTIQERVDEQLEANPDRQMITRLRLVGRGGVHDRLQPDQARQDLLLRLRELLADVTPWFWIKDILFLTRPDIDREQRSRRQDFVGELLRVSQDLQNRPDQSLFEDLAELFGHRRVSKVLSRLTEAEIQTLLQEAECLNLDLFES